VMAIWLLLWQVERLRSMRTPLFMTAIVPAAFGVAAMCGFGGVWYVTSDSGLRPNLSQLAILHRLRPGTLPRAVAYGSSNGSAAWPQLIPVSSVPERLLLSNITRRMGRDHPLLYLPRVPAGRYRVIANSSSVLEGTLEVVIGRSPRAIASCDLASAHDHACDVELAVSAEALIVRGDERARRTVSLVELKPIAVAPLLPHASDGPFGPFAQQAMRYGPREVFAISDNVYMEPAGFWLQPDIATDLIVVSSLRDERPTPAPLRLALRNGPAENHVSLEIERWRRDLTIAPNAEAFIDAPAARGGRTLLQMRVERGFRPSALDPKSGDRRLLGLWVELR